VREIGDALLQLDELRFAVGSPPRAAVEDNQGRASGAGGVEVDDAPALIRKADVGEAIAQAGADRAKIQPGHQQCRHS